MNLREKIQIQKKAEQSGPFPPLDDYEDYIKIWADVRFLRGRNFYAAKAANVKTDVEFIIRHRTDLDETMRVVHKGKDYEIEGIAPMDNNSSYMMIRAYEIKHDV
jgi:SPP1 family predicted phage head-tail adaptor